MPHKLNSIFENNRSLCYREFVRPKLDVFFVIITNAFGFCFVSSLEV